MILSLACPRCEQGNDITWMYIQGSSILFVSTCPNCEPFIGEEMYGVHFDLDGDEVLDLIEKDMPVLMPVEGRQFVNCSIAKQRSISLHQLMHELYNIKTE